MRRTTAERRVEAPAPAPAPETGSWSFGPADMAISSGVLAAVLAVCIPWGVSLHREVRSLDAQLQESGQRSRQLRSTLNFVEGRRVTLNQFRREVDRYMAEVEARPVVPWTTVIGELSRLRPKGLWTTRLTGEGPRFTAHVAAERSDLVDRYTQTLRQSPYVDFAALPAGETASPSTQVVGRLRGE